MNQKQALAQLRRVVGDKLGWRVDAKAPTAEQREEIRAAWYKARELVAEAEAARVARYREILDADPLYQQLREQAMKAKEQADNVKSGLYRFRITVGTIGSVFFSVKAQGDTWAEVVEKATGNPS